MILCTAGAEREQGAQVTYLAMLADELHQLGGVLRAAGEDIAEASRGVAHAPVDHVGPPAVDAAAGELVGGTSAGLGRAAVAVGDVDDLLHRVAADAGAAASEPR